MLSTGSPLSGGHRKSQSLAERLAKFEESDPLVRTEAALYGEVVALIAIDGQEIGTG